jgi:hypothetical protein
MQSKLNSKEFLKVDTLKCAAKSHLMAWYHDICDHGGMWGVFIPTSFSIQSEYPMGLIWDKRYLGATVHATQDEMGLLLTKLLLNPLMFPNGPFGNGMNYTVSNREGNFYVALNNILLPVHPNLIDKGVETINPYKGNMVTLTAHVRNMSNHL